MVSCGSGSDAGVVTLRVLHWAGEAEVTAEQRIADRFSDAHPEARVIVESVTTNFGEKLATAIASGTPPDVFLLDSPDFPAMVERGLVLDLAPYAARVGYPPDSVFPEVLDVFTRGSQLFALPKDFTPMVIYYNRSVFDEAGVPYPEGGGWTWEMFLEVAQRVTRDRDGDVHTDVYGLSFPRRLFEWVPFVWSAGGDILSPDGRRASGYLDSPETVATFRFLTSLHTQWGIVPPAQFLRSGDPMRRGRFYSGSQAMLVSGHWAMPQLLKYAARGELSLGIAPIPHREGERATTVIYASGWAVPVNVRHKRLAVELAAYLASEEAQRLRAASRIGIPAFRHLAQSLASQDTTGLEVAFLSLVRGARMSWGAVVMDFHEVEEMSNDIMDRHLLRGDDLQMAATDVAAAIDRVIAR
jgi:multiple sugar transport system substrate-binding protein